MIEIKRNTGENPVKVYAKTFEYEAYDQVKRLANYEPYLNSIIRIMPDAHAGKGCTVGTTMTLHGMVTPNLVGVDIGCGMLVINLGHNQFNGEPDLKKLDEVIHKFVPAGFEIHNQAWTKFNKLDDLLCRNSVDLQRAVLSIGTLGGGNHFVSIEQSQTNGDKYLVIHTGSRNLGVQVCKFYQDLAFKKLNEMSEIKKQVSNEVIAKCKAEGRQKDIPTELKKALANIKKPSASKELAHLTGNDFNNYIYDMEIVQEYAVLNRRTIANIILQKMGWKEISSFETIHNYIDTKNMILRKGSVSAQKDEMLIIPINMRDGSLICIGKGNPDWNWSAPHGAGRLLSRSKAKQAITMDEYEKSMEGIYTTTVNTSTLDESPMAYKPMDEIIECIEPTVNVIEVIKPIYNFKAGE